ncbi:MAG: nucleoside hydrolase [Capsulimonadaceae bacterium]|nr:nucleoside hydrolase [Capsulimonadaceae bacterium]
MKQRIILDTDIGDDIDDALALGLICSRPELDLIGVTTVFGNVHARSRQARTVLATAGGAYASTPVAAGCGASLASRPLHNWHDYLKDVLPNQDASCLPEASLPRPDPRHGVDFLIETILAGNGDIIPVPIGAMTNIAMALVKEPRIIAKIPKIVTMAAEPAIYMAEWNIRCDPEAAAIVFNSGIPMDVITWEMGHLVQFTPADIARLAAGPQPLAKNLSHAIKLWQGGRSEQMPSLYDPLTIVALIEPDILRWRQGRIKVELQGDATYGFTTFHADPSGPHRVACGVDRNRAIEFFFGSILKS